ncbi:MAG: pyruvate ferredoxin oxidoreductase, partial [Desulfurococcus sp.]
MLHEILFYGRGGQGAVTAANILVEAAMLEGKHGQGFP